MGGDQNSRRSRLRGREARLRAGALRSPLGGRGGVESEPEAPFTLRGLRAAGRRGKADLGGAMSPAAETRRQPPPPPPSLLLLLLLLLLSSPSGGEADPDATSALPSDVCATCHANATCQQRDGKNICTCNYGFVGNGRTYCQDKNECDIGASKICGEHASCHNTQGSFYCICLEGFQASSKNKIFIPNDGTKCIDLDECGISGICGLGGRCMNTLGSYECYCIEGYRTENGVEPFHSRTANTSCKVVDCGLPPSVPNAYSAVNKTTYGNKVVYTCQPGYVIESGNSTAVCSSSGQWKEADFVCKEIDCGKPRWFPNNTDIIWDNRTTLGSTIYYKCREGFQFFGEHNFSQCTTSQKWGNITFECKEVKDFVGIALNNSCLTWRRLNGNTAVNETYQLTMRMLGNESKKTVAESKISYTTAKEAIKICLELRQDANYSVEVTTGSTNLALKVRIMHPVVEKKAAFSNISIFNDTCIKWQRESSSEENYVLQIHGLRWYQKQFRDNMTYNFTTSSQTPAVCLDLLPGTNYTVNISTTDLNHSALIYMRTPITDPLSPEVDFVSVQGSAPLFSLRKAEDKNGPISSYQVIVIPWSLQCNFDCYSLTRLDYFSKGTDSEGYVAAEIPAKVVADNILIFALGDRLYYGDFYNAPLKQGKDYCVILRTISKWNGVKKQSCVLWAQIKDLSSPPQRLTIVLLGSVAALCSILLLLLSVACTTQHISPSSLPRKAFSNDTGHLPITVDIARKNIASSSSPMLQTVSLL
ncbi:sushi domain-containing protein 1 isoform X2 [Podarcis raffonei]|uniref:sushi domain-containing protein 1 isoform X2 n=1 Tax=Podarcis raffonei TaxID=65483 RepID=UPI0023294764|nr:sushi domain-containing protein 1 isoform X2 [Podarcis raffonei]